MTTDALDLARRLAAHPRWRWREGMRLQSDTVAGCVIVGISDDGDKVDLVHVAGPHRTHRHPAACPRLARAYPDLDDPATVGCLLAMLDEAVEDGDDITVWRVSRERWEVSEDISWRTRVHTGSIVGEALAAALLEVWGD